MNLIYIFIKLFDNMFAKLLLSSILFEVLKVFVVRNDEHRDAAARA